MGGQANVIVLHCGHTRGAPDIILTHRRPISMYLQYPADQFLKLHLRCSETDHIRTLRSPQRHASTFIPPTRPEGVHKPQTTALPHHPCIRPAPGTAAWFEARVLPGDRLLKVLLWEFPLRCWERAVATLSARRRYVVAFASA